VETAALPDLTLFDALQTAGYLLGTVLHALLLFLFWRRERRRPGEQLFAALVCAVGLWNLGQFLEVLLRLLFRGELSATVLIGCETLSAVGLLLLPSTLIHALTALFLERPTAEPRRPLVRALLTVATLAIYFPVLWLPQVFELISRRPSEPGFVQLRELVLPYLVWFVAVITAGAALSMVLARRASEPRARGFYLSLVGTLIVTGLVLVGIFLTGADESSAGSLPLELVIILVSTIPSAMFGYYVHRYDDVEFFLRRSLFYVVLIGATLLLYLWGITELAAALDRGLGLHHKIVEAILILGLISLFHPFRSLLHRLFNRIFFKQTFAYQQVLSELVQFMGRGSATQVRSLIEHVAQSLSAALEVEECEIVLVAPSGVSTYSTAPQRRREPPRVSGCVEVLGVRGWSYARSSDLSDRPMEHLAFEELRELGAEAMVAVRHEGRVVGLFLVGSKSDGRPLFAEEIDLLLALAEHLAISLENLKLLEEKRRLERQLADKERHLALGRFSSSVAHRVKNPLSSIKAITQSIALDLEESSDVRSDLMVVVSEVDRLTFIVEQLLGYAEDEAAEQASTVPVSEVISEVIELFQHEARLYEVAIRSDLEEAPAIRGGRAALREVLSNLIQNGIHAMTEGGGELIVRLRALPDAAVLGPIFGEGEWLEWGTEAVLISIIDGGAGISEEQRAKVFDPFFTTKTQGTGLGLAISRRKVGDLGGRIVASPREAGARGTVLQVLLRSAPGGAELEEPVSQD